LILAGEEVAAVGMTRCVDLIKYCELLPASAGTALPVQSMATLSAIYSLAQHDSPFQPSKEAIRARDIVTHPTAGKQRENLHINVV
jgi:hypothetical protein